MSPRGRAFGEGALEPRLIARRVVEGLPLNRVATIEAVEYAHKIDIWFTLRNAAGLTCGRFHTRAAALGPVGRALLALARELGERP